MSVPVVAVFKSVKFKRKSGNIIAVAEHAVACLPSCLIMTVATHHSAVSVFNSEEQTRAFRRELKRAEEECVDT
jgi:hypothetical protein